MNLCDNRQDRFLLYLFLLTVAVVHNSPVEAWSASGTVAQPDAQAIIAQSGCTGGLVVHVGCGDGKLTAALHANDRILVFGLDRDREHIAAARKQVHSLGLNGKVIIDIWRGAHIPCIDNIVNLLVVDESVSLPREEIERVLCPRGVALIQRGNSPSKIVKPWPAEIDEWTHYLHGPDNNAVAHDSLIEAPQHIQWVGGPKWARHHNFLSSTSAMVSAGGRTFSIMDEGPAVSLALPAKWSLIARDAFNGVILWKKPIGPWEEILRPFRSGPVDLARRLVAVGDRVYVTPGYNRSILQLDAATGNVLSEYDKTHDAVEFSVVDNRLFVVAGSMDQTEFEANRRRGLPSPVPRNKRVMVLDANTGAVEWEKADVDTSEILPSTLCISADHLLFHSPRHLICLSASSGQELWRVARPLQIKRLSWSAPTLVVHEDVVLSADRSATLTEDDSGELKPIQWQVTPKPGDKVESAGELLAFSLRDGKLLWRCPTALGYNSPPDVFVSAGLVWTGTQPGHNKEDFTEGRDLHTGEVKRKFDTDSLFSVAHHHRCYRDKATERFLLLGRTGVELIDLADGDLTRNCWVRGACQYGVMPANGLMYTPPHSCACYIQSKLSGFYALASHKQNFAQSTVDRLELGPAYDDVQRLSQDTGQRAHAATDDWPVFRHDSARTGRSTTQVAANLSPSWQTKVGGRLSSPVIADGLLLFASIDNNSIHALNAASGDQVWSRTVGGRVDSPPTLDSGLAVFGCADGYVYCLRLADGELVWRFRAAPDDLRTVSYGQVESVWPVTGSVLVRDGIVYSTAGRSSFLDGGMYLHRLALRTGKLLGETNLNDRDPESGAQREETVEDVELPGALPDVLVDDGQYIYLRDRVLDYRGVDQDCKMPHLYCSAGLLDDNWWHRTSWLWGERNWGRASGWAIMPGIRPSGRILTTDQDTVFGYGRTRVQANTMQGYHLFRASKAVKELDKKIKNNNVALAQQQKPARVLYRWSREVPLVARAIALTDQVLFIAGPLMAPADAGVNEPTFEAGAPAAMMAFHTGDGTDLAKLPIPSQPVFDGIALAGGKLFMATVDGNIACYEPK